MDAAGGPHELVARPWPFPPPSEPNVLGLNCPANLSHTRILVSSNPPTPLSPPDTQPWVLLQEVPRQPGETCSSPNITMTPAQISHPTHRWL